MSRSSSADRRDHSPEIGDKRKRSEPSRSVSPPPPSRRRRPSSPPPSTSAPPISLPNLRDADPNRRRERERQMAIELANRELAGQSDRPKVAVDLRAEMTKMAATRGGGAYIPPHRLRAIMAQAQEEQDSNSAEFQRLSWDALRKSINGLINKVNISNIKLLVPELFGENLIRGRGLFVRSMMRAQASSLPFTPIFASLVAIVNTKLPQVGELLLTRLIAQFRRSYKRNDKPTMTATTTFLAQLVNQQVAHELLALQILVLLLERPTDDSVEIAVSFMREVGAFLAESSPKANNGVFERFRAILHESGIDKRVQYMVEVLFQVRKDKYKDHPVIPEGLDLVEEEDAITHRISLDDELQVQEMLNVFKVDPDFEENEAKYKEIKAEILGDSDDESDEDADSESGSDDEQSEDEPDHGINADGTVDVHDQTGTNIVNLRRTIYLTIMSALDFEEATHKLLKINLGTAPQIEMCNMIIECCSQERSFSKFYGLMGERFCKLNQSWAMAYEDAFKTYYETIHRYETNRLRNIARFFGHILAQDGISWTVLDAVRMNEDDTTSSSRIFIKIMFQEVVENMGLKKLAERFKEPSLQTFLLNIFPVDNPKNTRFSINFFTSIGLGVVTEDMREHLKRAPALIAAQRAQLEAASSDSDSSTESSLSESSLSDSDDSRDSRRRGRSWSRSRSYSGSPRRRSYSRSRSRSYSRSRSRSPVGKARRRSYSRSRSRSYSRSPAPRRRSYSRSRSFSPAPRKQQAGGRGRSRTRSVDSRDGRSPPPKRGGGRARSYSRSVSRSRSPPPHLARGAGGREAREERRRSPSPSGRRRSPEPERSAGGEGGGGGKMSINPDRLRAMQGGGGGGGGGGGRGGYGGPPPRW